MAFNRSFTKFKINESHVTCVSTSLLFILASERRPCFTETFCDTFSLNPVERVLLIFLFEQTRCTYHAVAFGLQKKLVFLRDRYTHRLLYFVLFVKVFVLCIDLKS